MIYGSREDSAVAVPDVAGGGVYRVPSVTLWDGIPGFAAPNVLRLRPGERYRLRVETPLGVVSGETTVPIATAVDADRRTLNVDRDTLRLLGPARLAAGYLLRHETTTNTRERFTTTLNNPLIYPLARAGADADDKVWAFEWVREAIRPGHTQNFIVVAVDSNHFRYRARSVRREWVEPTDECHRTAWRWDTGPH